MCSSSVCSPHGAKRNADSAATLKDPDCASLHPGYGYRLGTSSGFPFSTMYVASSAALPLPTFFTA